MDFDVVIGNPPYNNDLYLDFVQAGYEALKPDGVMVMITPAKWQAKGGKKNELFREQIVPHMKEIVHWPDEHDVFDIGLPGGISVYSVYKNTSFDNKSITILTSTDCSINTNGTEISDLHNGLCSTIVSSIVDKMIPRLDVKTMFDFTQNLYFDNSQNSMIVKNICDPNTHYEVVLADEIFGYFPKDKCKSLLNIGKYKVIQSCMLGGSQHGGTICHARPMYIGRPNQIHKGTQETLIAFDTEDEAKSFISFMQSRLVRFLITIGLVQSKPCVETYRFVPDPGAFDHIFTDAELYQKYGLTQDEINIIESVIKERK